MLYIYQIGKQQDELHIYFDQALRVNVDDIDRWQQTQRLLTQDEIVQLKTAIKDCRDRVLFVVFNDILYIII